MQRPIKYFIVGVLSAYPIVFIGFIFFFPIKLALIVSLITSVIFGIFSLGFMVRTLSTQSFEINTTNKDPKLGLDWYQERIFEQLYDLRFLKHSKIGEITTFSPRGLYKVYESEVLVERTPYYIKVTGSRLVIRLLSAYVDISI